MDNPLNNAHPEIDDEISLLDMLLVVLENLRLLVLAPIGVGLIALGVAFTLPLKFESHAVQSGDQTLVNYYMSAQVRDQLMREVQYQRSGEDLDSARTRLAKDLTAALDRKGGGIQLKGIADTPERAKQLVDVAIRLANEKNQPRVDELRRMVERFELAVKREREYTLSADRVARLITAEGRGDQSALVTAQAQLLDAARNAQSTSASLAAQIAQAEKFQMIQDPTLPTKKSGPKRALIAVISALAAGFFLLLFVFVRQAIKTASHQAESAAKIAQIQVAWRRALGRRA